MMLKNSIEVKRKNHLDIYLKEKNVYTFYF